MEPGLCPICGTQMTRSSEVEVHYKREIEVTMDYDINSPSLQPPQYRETDSRWRPPDQDAEDFELLEAALAEGGPTTSLDDMIKKYGLEDQ